MSAKGAGPVLLVGAADDEHVVAVGRRLAEAGVDATVLDTLRFPERTRLACEGVIDALLLDGVPLPRPRSIYLRGLYVTPISFGVDVAADMAEDWHTTLVAFREKAEFLIGWMQRFEAMGVRMYNTLSSGDRTRKPFQLARLAQAGLPIPETLWTNDPEAVRAFARRRGRVAYKPVAGGAATRELTEADLTDERLDALSGAAVTFQELLPGEDLRVFVVDGEIVAVYRIATDSLDYRQNERGVELVELDAASRGACLRAAELLGLRFTGIDLKRADDGRFRILELNGSPMFLGFDSRGGADVLGAFTRALARP